MVGAAAAFPAADKAAPPPPAPVYKPGPPAYRPAPYNPPPPYKPAGPYKKEDLPPQPYQFEYGVADQYSGTNFQAAESQDDKGEVYGKSLQPDPEVSGS